MRCACTPAPLTFVPQEHPSLAPRCACSMDTSGASLISLMLGHKLYKRLQAYHAPLSCGNMQALGKTCRGCCGGGRGPHPQHSWCSHTGGDCQKLLGVRSFKAVCAPLHHKQARTRIQI